MTKVTVIDYGVGNLLSVKSAFEHCGATINFCTDPDEIIKSDRLLLPGVGSFGEAIDDMTNASLIEPVIEFSRSGKPVLGICLGLQMLFTQSAENISHKGLNLIAGDVVEIPHTGTNRIPHRIPHVGWNEISPCYDNWSTGIFEGIVPGTSVYFAHSFMGEPKDKEVRMANCEYNGIRILAALQKENVFGCQFHPEISGPAGLIFIENYLRL